MQLSTRYIISLCCGILLSGVLWVTVFYCELGLPTRSSYWANELFKNKILAAKQINAPKLLIVAGSSTHFGVNAEKISKEIGRAVINFGTFGGLDVEYFFLKAKEILNPGDTVLLPIEYTYFREYPKYTSVYVDHVVANDRALFLSWPLKDQLQIMIEMPFHRLIAPYKFVFSKKPKSGISEYSWDYHPYGDTHSNNRVLLLPASRQARENSEPDIGLFQLSEKARVWNDLRSFVLWCKKHHISVIATVPNHLYFENLQGEIVKNNLNKIKEFYLSIGVPYIGDPYKAMFDRALYLDTVYHPNELGKDLYTNYLIHTIKNEAPQLVQKDSLFEVQQVADKVTLLNKALSRFNGWESLRGLSPIMEPNRAKGRPLSAVGTSDIELQIHLMNDQEIHIVTEFLPSFNQEKVNISIDGKLLWQQQYAEADKSYMLELSTMLQEGKHIIRIQSDQGTSFNGKKKKFSLLFKRLLVNTENKVSNLYEEKA